ncbi:hypothetical protein Tco_0696538 [Tanacetum coccineum]
MNTRFWTEKDVTRSKEFIAAIERRLKTRRIYPNLECFVGGRVRDIDYRLLQRTECFCNSDACYYDPEKYEHASPKVTTSHGGNTTTRMIWRFIVDDDLKENSKITQVKGTKLKDYYLQYKDWS